jgi:hypothetical protein
MKKLLVAALVVGFSFTAFAQSNKVGTLEKIQGIVSVSANGVVTNVTANTTLSNENVVLNSGNGSSLVRFENGCNIELKANQVFTVNSEAPCAALLASVKTVGTPLVTAADMTSYFTAQNLLIGAGVVGAGLLIRDQTKNKASGS